jgi:hypothetical protein
MKKVKSILDYDEGHLCSVLAALCCFEILHFTSSYPLIGQLIYCQVGFFFCFSSFSEFFVRLSWERM